MPIKIEEREETYRYTAHIYCCDRCGKAIGPVSPEDTDGVWYADSVHVRWARGPHEPYVAVAFIAVTPADHKHSPGQRETVITERQLWCVDCGDGLRVGTPAAALTV